ncbi:histidine phosphatase family protein [Larsenimonas rhizosphaerae]|uniref:histidine phosphatase family protein n=1 Tax=Larsenimonas rhizosphaerae TaxID=2944682 RepID=UPI002033C409|nr:histidine phosphatase family protein [Larsenimonas rhizosphaerae]MCM2130490.1 histidine phosphatase family protein [Larsenimonas rhizosphaerae]
MNAAIVDLVRHGACEGPACLRGHTDVSLSAAGQAQMDSTLGFLPRPQALFSSPLMRCHVPAQRWAEYWDMPLDHVAALAEMNFGDWDGVPLPDLHARDPEALAAFWARPAAAPPPGAEGLAAFEARVMAGWQACLSSDRDCSHRVIITHAGVIKALMATLLQLGHTDGCYVHALDIPYAGLVRLRLDWLEGRTDPLVRLLHLGIVQGAMPLPTDIVA